MWWIIALVCVIFALFLANDDNWFFMYGESSWGSIFSALIQTTLLCGFLYVAVKVVKFLWYF